MRRVTLVAATALTVIGLDQWSKHWAVNRLSPTSTSPGEIFDVGLGLEFRLAFNQGMAFSQFSGAGPLIALAALLIVGVLCWFARSMTSRFDLAVVGVVMGGAIGNLIDRALRAPLEGYPTGFLRGAVVDFAYTSFWATFNVADACIVVGAILLAVVAWRQPVPAEPEPVNDEPVNNVG